MPSSPLYLNLAAEFDVQVLPNRAICAEATRLRVEDLGPAKEPPSDVRDEDGEDDFGGLSDFLGGPLPE